MRSTSKKNGQMKQIKKKFQNMIQRTPMNSIRNMQFRFKNKNYYFKDNKNNKRNSMR